MTNGSCSRCGMGLILGQDERVENLGRSLFGRSLCVWRLLGVAALVFLVGCAGAETETAHLSDPAGSDGQDAQSAESGRASSGAGETDGAENGLASGSDGGGSTGASDEASQSESGGDGTAEDGRESGAATARDAADFVDATPVESTPREDVPSALRDRSNPEHPDPLIDLGEIRSGGVPPDAIPALSDPEFEPVAEVDWVAEREPVLVLNINGDARAYPLAVMTWHELVNGTVGGLPVTVSYCPLCNSAVAYDRRVGERVLDFGTSGELLNSSLVMYDRQTESLWSHFTGEAVAGHLTGAQLDFFPMQTVRFGAFAEAHPQGLVLSRDTGHSRQYGINPYVGYDNPDGVPFLFDGEFDDRLHPMARVVAVRSGGEYTVIPYEVLATDRVVAFSVAGQDLVALFEPGTASALDSSVLAEGRDVGATGVFQRPVDLNLEPHSEGGFIDRNTGATFDILGSQQTQTGNHPNLTPIEHLDTFWFAAAAFDQQAKILTP